MESMNPAIATISATGAVTAVSRGTAVIQGQYRGTSAMFPLGVIGGVDIVQLQINSGRTFTVGQSVAFAPRLILTGNGLYDLDPPTRAAYSSSNVAIPIGPDGVLSTAVPGSTDVTVSYLDKSATARVVIVAAAP